ncbi:major facilitator superfamily domain-containing protein [Xylariomycetidae sp. FL2044]|nr:major facilitator superfamily domain-containing protein [Xylariomycetidae sp. FL2044]
MMEPTLQTDLASSPPGDQDRGAGKSQHEVPRTSVPQVGTQKRKIVGFYLSFLALLVMCFVVSLDATVLAIAVPVITHELHGTTLEAFWASISFVLAVVVVQPVYTSVSNVLGRMLPLYASFVLFVAGSIVFACAQDMGVLIAGRVFQGLGSGGLDVLNEIIVADITTLKERPLYLGLLAVPMAAGTILGPIVGGLLSEYSTWRWIGWINLPISGLGLFLVIFFLKLRVIQQSVREKLARLDWGGLILFAVGCTLFSTPLAWAGAMYPWSSWRTLLPLCLGVVLLGIFGWYESKPKEPVFPYRIFRSRTGSMTLLAAFLHGAIVYSAVLYVPLFFQATVQDVDDMGLATGILVSFRLFGGLVGLATSSTVFNNVFASYIDSLGPLPSAIGALGDAREAIGFIPLLREIDVVPELLQSIIDVYRNSMYAVFWTSAGIGTLGFLISLLIQEKSLEKEELGRQQFDERT